MNYILTVYLLQNYDEADNSKKKKGEKTNSATADILAKIKSKHLSQSGIQQYFVTVLLLNLGPAAPTLVKSPIS